MSSVATEHPPSSSQHTDDTLQQLLTSDQRVTCPGRDICVKNTKFCQCSEKKAFNERNGATKCCFASRLQHQEGTAALTERRISVSRHYGCMLEAYCIRKQELWNLCFFRGWRKWQLIEQHWFMTFFMYDRGTTGRLQLSDEEHCWWKQDLNILLHMYVSLLPHSNRKKKNTLNYSWQLWNIHIICI